jgi:hypothetical protein
MIGGLYRSLLALARNFAFTRRTVVALLMIGSLFLAQFGYPVWEVAEKGKGDEPFPCQFSRCGCKTREQCRHSCCCHSKQEKIAWALARKIDPNRVAVLTAAEQKLLAISTPKLTTTQTCCETGSGSCCKAAKKSCCGGSLVKSEKAQLRWVLAIEAQKCRGTGVEWIQAGFVAPPPVRVTLTIIPRETPAVSDAEPLYFSPAQEPLLRPV